MSLPTRIIKKYIPNTESLDPLVIFTDWSLKSLSKKCIYSFIVFRHKNFSFCLLCVPPKHNIIKHKFSHE